MSDSSIELIINKEIAASVESVFKAWTRPDLLKQWFFPDSAVHVAKAEVDLKVGGRYLLHMHNSEEGSDHIVSGQYQEVVPNEKLVFDWKWQDGVESTHVTIELKPKGPKASLLTLTHRGFSEQDFADKHTMGWEGCLVNLGNYLQY